jgi:hypothetical protein
VGKMGGTRKGVEREKPTGPSTSQHGSGTAHGNGTIGAGAHRHIGASPHRGHRAPPCGTPRPMAICRPRILRPAAIGAGAHRCICTAVTVHRRAARHGRWQYAAADGKMAIVARWCQRGGSSTAAARRRHSSGGSASSVLRTRTTVICSNGHMQCLHHHGWGRVQAGKRTRLAGRQGAPARQRSTSQLRTGTHMAQHATPASATTVVRRSIDLPVVGATLGGTTPEGAAPGAQQRGLPALWGIPAPLFSRPPALPAHSVCLRLGIGSGRRPLAAPAALLLYPLLRRKILGHISCWNPGLLN